MKNQLNPSQPANAYVAGDKKKAKALAWKQLRQQHADLPSSPASELHRAAQLTTLAKSLADTYDYDDAEAVLSESLTLYPGFMDSHVLHVELLVQKNDLDGAEAAARQALEDLPEHPYSYKLLIDVLCEKGHNAAALEQLSALEGLMGQNAQARLIQAETLVKLGKDAQAAKTYASAINLAPGAQAQLLTRAGDLQHNAGDTSAAEASYRRALSITGNAPQAVFGLVNTLYSQGRIADGDKLAAQAYKAIDGYGANYFDAWAPLTTGLPKAESTALDKKWAVVINGLGELPGLPLGMSLLKGYAETNSDFKVTTLDLSALYFRDVFAAMRAGKASVSFAEQDKLFEAIDVFNGETPGFYDVDTYRELAPYFFKYASLFANETKAHCQRAIYGQSPVPWFVREYAEQIVAAKPFVVGLSVTYTGQHTFSILLAKEIKRLDPTITTVFGGGFFNAKNLEPFLASSWVDYLILHDGEVSFLKLLQALDGDGDVRAVPNIAFFDAELGQVFHNDEGAGVKQDDLAYADYSDYDLSTYFLPHPVAPILSSRGCYWRRCTFCDHFASYAGTYKTQTIVRVVDELQHHVEKHGIRHFSFVDEMISARRLMKLSDEIIARGLDINFYALAKPTKNDFTDEILDVMYEAGCRAVYWGVESGSDRILDLMDKGNDVESTSRSLIAAHKAGIRNHLFMIIGYPTETEAELKETLHFLHDHSDYIDKILPNFFNMMPGTPVCDRYWDFGVSKAQRVRCLCDHQVIDYVIEGSISRSEAKLYTDNLAYTYFDHFNERGIYFGKIRDQIIVSYAGAEGGDKTAGAGAKKIPDLKPVLKTMKATSGVKRIASDDTTDKVYPLWPRTLLLASA